MNHQDMQELPLGLGMAMAQYPQALQTYAAMSEAGKQEVLARARRVSSKREMQQLVAELAQGGK